ncbi:MAG TPA: ATP-binding protein [Anaerolineae bacterium]|nr:ATP-binding protein [Anaerolineae bacterium]
MPEEHESNQQEYLPSFAPGFLIDYARKMISDPKIALIELVANCWDAGADTVEITWPEESVPNPIVIQDDGTGMTKEQFTQRWLQFNYDRREVQGEDVVFPPGNQPSHRKAFGKNGKGRLSAFCFANRYMVTTWCNGEANSFEIQRTAGIIAQAPYKVTHQETFSREGHGTIVRMTLVRSHIPIEEARDLVGSKFIADPTFTVHINGVQVELANLEHLIDSHEIVIPDLGKISVSQVDTQKTSKSSLLHGIAWWVNHRLVGELSWEDYKRANPLDRRTVEARRYTFVVLADLLADDVMEDWSGFQETTRYQIVRNEVFSYIRRRIHSLMSEDYKQSKRVALEANREQLRKLSVSSRRYIGQLVDGIQEEVLVPDNILIATVGVLANLEQARSGYSLLEKLSRLEPSELDELDEILSQWSVQDARLVLDELDRRLRLIERLEDLVEDPTSDELHQIHPLFEKGLWIFGPEYESVHFRSNSSLLTVIRDLFKDTSQIPLKNRRWRPDLVALPDASIGVYSCDGYTQLGDVNGYGKILVVELKKGGSNIGLEECQQGQRYAAELRKSGKSQNFSKIVVFVLGTNVLSEAQADIEQGNIVICARPYGVVLRMAHARTFNLKDKIESIRQDAELYDMDVEEIVAPRTFMDMPEYSVVR